MADASSVRPEPAERLARCRRRNGGTSSAGFTPSRLGRQERGSAVSELLRAQGLLGSLDKGGVPSLGQAKELSPEERTAAQAQLASDWADIDTENLGPDPKAVFKTPSGEVLRANDPNKPVITYVARNLEPYRGFHTFMRALPAIQRERKDAHVLIVGGDDVSYGSRPKEAKNWREKMLAEVGRQIDPSRTHFLGKLPYADYKRVLQVSSAHVYLTYPFVLSWSCLEAMATGCLMVAGDTATVREVLQDGRNGRLVPSADVNAIADSLGSALGNHEEHQQLREQARRQAASLSRRDGTFRFETALLGAGAANCGFGRLNDVPTKSGRTEVGQSENLIGEVA